MKDFVSTNNLVRFQWLMSCDGYWLSCIAARQKRHCNTYPIFGLTTSNSHMLLSWPSTTPLLWRRLSRGQINVHCYALWYLYLWLLCCWCSAGSVVGFLISKMSHLLPRIPFIVLSMLSPATLSTGNKTHIQLRQPLRKLILILQGDLWSRIWCCWSCQGKW